MGGELDVCSWAGAVALRDNVTRATFALAALGSDTQFELDLVKAHARTGVAGDFAVGDSAADTNNHGLACWLVIRWLIINANPSHLQYACVLEGIGSDAGLTRWGQDQRAALEKAGSA
jgi:hypothetical protein